MAWDAGRIAMELLLGVGFVGATIAVTLGFYFAMRWVTGGDPDARSRDLAGSVIFRISALHGLILALVFAQEMVEYQQLKYEAAIEANAIADVYFDAGRYGGEGREPIQGAMKDYVALIVDEEWALLADTGRLAPAAWGRWDVAYNGVLDLSPATDRQRSLRDHMLSQLHAIAETRVKRENHGSGSISGMFWFAAMSGVVLISLAYYSFPPERFNLVLISMFGAFTGIILFLIYAFSNPYGFPGQLEPGPLLRLQEQLARSTSG